MKHFLEGAGHHRNSKRRNNWSQSRRKAKSKTCTLLASPVLSRRHHLRHFYLLMDTHATSQQAELMSTEVQSLGRKSPISLGAMIGPDLGIQSYSELWVKSG